MKAVKVARPGVLTIAERPCQIGSDEVLIKVKAVGMWPDMHVWRQVRLATYPHRA